MNDLLITLNTLASKKNGFVVLTTYYTKKVEVNKSGRYRGGRIVEADALECMSVNNVKCELIKHLFSKYCIKLSLNSFYISFANLCDFSRAIKDYSLFFMDNTDRSLNQIKGLVEQQPKRKCKYQYSIGTLKLSHSSDGILYAECAQASAFPVNLEEPIPWLCYDRETQAYLLLFDYGGERIRYSDKQLSTRLNNNVYLRNYLFEKNIVVQLSRAHFTKLTMGRFLYSGRMNENDMKSMLNAMGIFLNEDENVIIPKINIQRGDSGWFEIDLKCDCDGEVLDLASKIDLFRMKNAINFKGQKVLLPTSIIEAKDNLVCDGKKLKIKESNIFNLLHIIYESGRKVSDFFSYSDITIDIDERVLRTAYPYQIDGIKWLKFLFLNHLGGCLADDMGLGKTFQIISFLEDKAIKEKIKKVLIIVPRSLLTNWLKEFKKFNSCYNVAIYHGAERRRFDFKNCNVILTTYNTALLDEKTLNCLRYSLVIFDEIQIVKNRNSITSDSMKRINAEVKFGLSGTPMENGISELWNVMDMLNPGAFSSHDSFLRRYNNHNYDELRMVLSLFIMRRTKKSVLAELPPKMEEIVYCDMDKEQRKLYSSISTAVKNAIMNMKAFAAPVILKGLTLLRECCCHPLLLGKETNVDGIAESCKLDSLRILVANLFESGHKVLIFSVWTSMLQIIRNELERNDLYRGNIYYLDGKTRNRNEEIIRFERAEKGIFLISIKAGGVGLNLVSAQDVIIYDPWWNPFVEQQAVDRAHRIGQNKVVTVYKLVAANTLEEKIIDIENDKLHDFCELFNGIPTDKNLDLDKIIRLL